MTRHDVLRIVILALLVAVVIHVLTIRRAPAQGVGFIPPGTWLTTERGERVCITTQTLDRHTRPDVGFCNNWQAPFYPVQRGQQYPVGQGWMRWGKPWPASGNYLQFHNEQGWKP